MPEESKPSTTPSTPPSTGEGKSSSRSVKVLLCIGICLFLTLGLIRVYYGGGRGIRPVFKGTFSFTDTFVNLDDIFGMPRIVVAAKHPAVKRQMEERGWIQTDEQVAADAMKKAQEEMRKAMSATGDGTYVEFPLSNFTYRTDDYGITTFVGEIKNPTQRNFNLATFKLNIYDTSGTLLSVENVMINNFPAGSTRSFSTMATAKFPNRIKYRLEYDSGF